MIHILIAEDEMFLADLYRMHLKNEGWSVENAKDGAEALKKLQRKKPDILLLDLLMPGTDGFAVLEWLFNNRERGFSFPVIVITNLSQHLNQKRCEDLGAAAYVVKSDVDAEDLVEIIRKHIPAASKQQKKAKHAARKN